MNDLNKLKRGEIGKYWGKNWDMQKYLQYIKSEKMPKTGKIIAVFIEEKDYHFENYKQISPFFSRNLRVAKRLEGYSLEKIKQTCQFLKEQDFKFKWTLETVEKYIVEDINILKGEDPILILKDGEKVYDIERIKSLEKGGRIRWDGQKWVD